MHFTYNYRKYNPTYIIRNTSRFNHACTKLNWTQLNCSIQFSFPPAVHWTRDDLQRFGDEIVGRRRFFTIAAHSRESAKNHWTKTGDELQRRRFLTARFNAQWKTELNSTQLNIPVQFSEFSFPLCIGLKLRIQATTKIACTSCSRSEVMNVSFYSEVNMWKHGVN